MKHYKVIALSVGGSKNKVFHVGEEVRENQFPDGVADQLVEKGFLKEIGKDDEVPKMVPQEPQTIEKPVTSTLEVKGISEVTRKDMMAFLKKQGVEFATDISKKELYELWKEEVAKI